MFPCHVGERLLKLSKICPASFMSGCVNVFKKKTAPQNIAVWTVWGIEKTKAPKSDASNFPRSQKQIKAEPGLSVVSRRSTTHQGLPQKSQWAGPSWAEPTRRAAEADGADPAGSAGLWPGEWDAHPGRPNQWKGRHLGFASTNEHPKAKCIGVPKYYIYIINYI